MQKDFLNFVWKIIPYPSGLWYYEGPSCFGRKAVLKMFDLLYQSYELNHTIRVAPEEPEAEQRWINGEGIFKDIMQDNRKGDTGLFSNDFQPALVHKVKGNPMEIQNSQLS